jgi:3D (Asp-Asp-Asp) domain-containing protein
MRAKFKSELLSFEDIVLYVIIAIIFIFWVSMCLLHYNNKAYKNQEEVTTEQVEKTVEATETAENKKTTEEETNVKSIRENKETTKTDNVAKVESTTKTTEKEIVTVEEPPELISLGEFRLTAYCKCSTCCGKWSNNPTASGVEPRTNHTIAVDTSVIPFGTKVMIDGVTYTAEDTGSAIKGNRIDIYMGSHSKAMDFGVKYAEVFVVHRSE